MRQEEVSIYNFKKGDIITRIKPIIDPETEKKDYSFVGRKLTFMGIANATIYLAQEFDFLAKLFLGVDKNIIQIPIDLWPDGWAYHIEPDFLDEGSIMVDDESKMQEQLNLALENENFEIAEDIKRKLEELRKKGGKKR